MLHLLVALFLSTASTAPPGSLASTIVVMPAAGDAVVSLTIDDSNDLPLAMYAEDTRSDGPGVLRYSVIFSNEDGGTATPALLARWGRTTDIEMMYEEDWSEGRMVTAHYQ